MPAVSIAEPPAVSFVERLEQRTLLSLSAAGAEFKVNTFTTGTQALPAIAMDGDGDFVVAWQSNGQDPGGSTGVFAQRFNSAGVAQGAEIHVNTFTTSSQAQAAVAMDIDGDFVIAWNSSGQDSASSVGVYAQRFNAAGVAQGPEFRVNTFTTGDQFVTSVAMNASGDFVIAWQSNDQEGVGNAGNYAQRYNSAGLKQGAEFHVNTFTTGFQSSAAVAMDASGDFVITWYSDGQDGSNYGVYAKRYNAAGVEQARPCGVAAGLGNEFRVNTQTTSAQGEPSVAIDNAGNFVIAWHSLTQDGNSYGVYAKRYTAAGVEQAPPGGVPLGVGNEFRVNTNTTRAQAYPSVAMDGDGDFLVSWQSYAQEAALSGYGIYAQQFNSAGSLVGGEFKVNTFTTGVQTSPAAACDANGNCVVSWYGFGQQDTGHYGIYAQRYAESNADIASPMGGGLFIGGEEVPPGQRREDPFSALTLSFSEDMSVTGGTSGPNSASNRANYRLFRNGVDITNSTITFVSFGFNATSRKFQATLSISSFATVESGSYVVSARDSLRDVSGNALDGNFDGTPGGDFSRAFSVVLPDPAGAEFRVNSTTAQSQSDPVVAKDINGNFVVAWQSRGQDGDGASESNIYAQRYNAAGVPQGGEFRVNTHTTGTQSRPAIAMSINGDFVIAWESNDEVGDPVSVNALGVFAQRFSPGGVPLGGELHVNVFTPLHQFSPSVAMDEASNFVITWTGQDINANFDIYARRYNAAGVPAGDFKVNSYTFNSQGRSAVAMDGDGDFVVVWSGEGSGDNLGLFAQRYNAATVVQGSQFRVNLFTPGDQDFPAVAMDAFGNFVVTWYGFGTDVESAIRAQRFDSAGAPQGSEFRVNANTSDTEEESSVSMDASGDFVVTFTSAVINDVFARRYDEAGVAQGNQFPVNTFTTSSQTLPAVAMDPFGDFVIAWKSYSQDGSSYGVYAQRYARLTKVNISNFLFQTSPQRLQFTFNDNVTSSLGTNDLVVQNLTTSQTIPSANFSLSYDAATNTATFSYTGNAGGATGVLPDGNYRATVLSSGTPLEQNHVFDFFVLAADANHDRTIDVADLGILASNWQQSPRNFSQADFDYSGMVDVNDLGILATHWQLTLAPSAPFAPATRAITRTARLVDYVMPPIPD
jgi:hypothetical protein